jgi:uncharacterized protein with HEPN domain
VSSSTAGVTTPSQFRLQGDTLAALDRIAAYLSEQTHTRASRTDALRYAVGQTVASLGEAKKLPAKSRS